MPLGLQPDMLCYRGRRAAESGNKAKQISCAVLKLAAQRQASVANCSIASVETDEQTANAEEAYVMERLLKRKDSVGSVAGPLFVAIVRPPARPLFNPFDPRHQTTNENFPQLKC